MTSTSVSKKVADSGTVAVISRFASAGTVSTSVSGQTITATLSGVTPSASNPVLIRVTYSVNGQTPTPPVVGDLSVRSAQHTEGYSTEAFCSTAHAEGLITSALGEASHAEGRETIAFGKNAHAGGYKSIANGTNSFVHGEGLTANKNNQVVIGSYNTIDDNAYFIIGNGTNGSPNNVFTVKADGAYVNSSPLITTSGLASYLSSNNYINATSLNNTLANYSKASYLKNDGYLSVVNASSASDVGNKATASRSMSFGANCESDKYTSFLFGQHLNAKVARGDAPKFVTGRYNEDKANTLFEVGNGSALSAKNAFEIYHDGHAELATTLTLGAPYKGDSAEIPAVNGGIDIWGTEDFVYPNGGRLVRLNKDGLKFGCSDGSTYTTAPTNKFIIGNPMATVEFTGGAGMEPWGLTLKNSDSFGTTKLSLNDGNIFIDTADSVYGTGTVTGYYKFPVNDGSTAANRYTVATQEYVDDAIAAAIAGALTSNI